MKSAEISKAVELLAKGQVVGMPTETVYGLAARIDLPAGIEAIFKTKERPFFDPLIVHVSELSQLQNVTAGFPEVAKALADKFWPGPLTMVLPKNAKLNSMITSGLDSVGVRMPAHPVALDLIRAVGVPLAAPSANKFGKTSPTSAAHVRQEFQKENVFVLEGGDSQIGIESTVLLVKENGGKNTLSVLRKGHVLRSDIEKYLSSQGIAFEFVETVDKKESPGHMKHHYMPPVPLILCLDPKKSLEDLKKLIQSKMSELPDKIEEVAIVKPKGEIHNIAIMKLSEDPLLATRSFYAQLRDLAAQKPDCILLYKEVAHSGERWESLYDRVNKAASLIV
ncbi:L-threonylcarbamoyladenylate synthase [Bdellovibrio sp. HCB337]|uniref:L-threonylcarbamoyladenylate synthase n=1 Tax=Bdellovibrio sp. HCB337 TaxID=3394358 RepID=UPI0039A66080